ncbi:hypothetical protein BH20VER1_BH20VER1_21330 [soil metagenome]
MLFSLGIFVLVALYLTWTGVALIYDGAYQLVVTLVNGSPFYHVTRYHSWVVWQPVVWLSPHTSSLALLQALYALPFLLAPAVGLALSWWMVRKHAPHLIVWAIFGIAATTLPGQIFVINDSIFQQHLFWPVFLGILVPLRTAQRVVLCMLALFQLSHPIGAVLMSGAAVAAAGVGILRAEERRRYFLRAAIALLFAAVCVAKILLWPDTYAQQEFTWTAAYERFAAGVRGWPGLGLIGVYAAAWFLRKDRARLVLLSLLLAAGCWIWWAADVRLWPDAALNYRRWIVPLTAPFFALAVWEYVKGAAGSATLRHRATAALPLLFAAVLCLQATHWRNAVAQLSAELEKMPEAVVTLESLPFMKDTPLEHWGTTALSILLQGRQPRRLIVQQASLPLLEKGVPLSASDVKPAERSGWFDFTSLQPLVGAGREEPPR